MPRRFYVSAALAAVAMLAIGSLALAAKLGGPPNPPNTKSFHASLNGYHETPSISTQAFGEFDATLVDPATLHFVLTYSGLEGGNAAVAHVHFGQVGFPGGVSFFLCGGGGKPACPASTAATIEGDVTAADVVGPAAQGIAAGQFDEIVSAMQAGQAYANVHTATFPSGEIRGQINNAAQKEFDN